MVFNQIKRSNYGKGCDAFNNILESKGRLCYIPTGNACFRKCLEFIYKRDFSKEYKEFIIDSGSFKNIITSEKIQPFCRKYNINLGSSNQKQQPILPKTVNERRICLLIHNNLFCVIWKNNQSTFPDAKEEKENIFKYEETQIDDNILQQVIEYKFPISYEMNCLNNVFAFDLETCNVEYSEYCEQYAAGVYHLNNLYWCFNGNLDKEELAIERSKVHVFDRENGDPVLKLIDYVINIYKGKPKYVINKYGKQVLSSYKYQMVGHNASGFDNYIVLNSLPTSYKCIKIIKTSRSLIKLSFKAGSVTENDREFPTYMKFVCSKCHISGSLKGIQKEYNIKPDLMKGEIDHDLINIGNYKKYENLWRPYLIDDVLGLAYVVAKHGNSIQKITGVSYKNSLTEAALGWSCLGRYLKEDKRILYTPKNKYVRDFIKQTVHGGRVLACNKKFVSESFTDVVNVLEKFYGIVLEVSVLFDK